MEIGMKEREMGEVKMTDLNKDCFNNSHFRAQMATMRVPQGNPNLATINCESAVREEMASRGKSTFRSRTLR